MAARCAQTCNRDTRLASASLAPNDKQVAQILAGSQISVQKPREESLATKSRSRRDEATDEKPARRRASGSAGNSQNVEKDKPEIVEQLEDIETPGYGKGSRKRKAKLSEPKTPGYGAGQRKRKAELQQQRSDDDDSTENQNTAEDKSAESTRPAAAASRAAEKTADGEDSAGVDQQVNEMVEGLMSGMQDPIIEAMKKHVDKALKPVREQLQAQIDKALEPVQEELQKQIQEAIKPIRKDLDQHVENALEPVRRQLYKKVEEAVRASMR